MNLNVPNVTKLGALADGKSSYERWAEAQGVPIVRAFFIQNLNEVILGTWPRKGGRGAIINLEGTGDTDDAYICEIFAGGKSSPERHVYEELVYVLEGSGATTIWQEGSAKQTFEWQAGSLFVIPLNAWFQHFNGSGNQSARYIAFTSAPLMMNLLNDEDFIFNCPYIFRNRFDGEADYFKGEGAYYGKQIWDVNFIANIHDLILKESEERGRGNQTTIIEIGCSALIAHMSQFSVGRYKKAHRHAAGAQIIILGGAGYSLLWPEGSAPKRCDWQPNSVISPPDQWFHQHFNTSDRETRYLAIRWNSKKYKVFKDIVDRSVKEGGTQIEYEDEDPRIRRDFEAELAKRGIKSRMS
jgi:oxalate decarboxylase/phosphoglucose isomerase-like protein (cupin superfamily)